MFFSSERPEIIATIVAAGLCLILGAACTDPSSANNSATLQIVADTASRSLAGALIDGYQESSRSTETMSLTACTRACVLQRIEAGSTDAALLLQPPAGKLFTTPIGFEQLVFVTHPTSGIKNLTSNQMQELLGGVLSSWESVDGERVAVQVIIMPSESSTWAALEAVWPLVPVVSPSAIVASSEDELVEFVRTTPGAFGVVGASHVTGGVDVLTLDGSAPDQANTQYLLAAPVVFITQEDPHGEIRQFLDWILNDEGQNSVRRFLRGVRD